ncbi:MAG TPA: DUF4384 domain-containing protein [Thermoanaerobaculia bacterium]|nr:DUF4384 domain-containing protein [Thermoanaerobaculia bacterium]
MTKKLLVFALAAFTASHAFAAEDESQLGAKEIYWDPNRPPIEEPVRTARPPANNSHHDTASPQLASHPRPARDDDAAPRTFHKGSIGIRYWIELIDPSRPSGTPVTSDRTFQSGDRIRLHFSGNSDGRIMIIQLGSSGTASVLFPDPEKGISENALSANVDQVLPTPQHWFRFDDQAGTERLVVLFAKTQRELDDTYHVRPRMDAGETSEFLRTTQPPTGGKDLRIETETEEADRIGTYGVSIAGKPVVLQIALRHH